MHYLVANIAIRTGISPQAILALSPDMFNALIEVFNADAKRAQELAAKGVRR